MLLSWKHLILLPFIGCLGGELLLQGPVFVKEPSNSIFPVGSEDKKITLNCEARGNPSPHYRWQLNGSDIDLSMEYRYKLIRGNLVVMNPNRNWDTGNYQCFATNSVGTIVSREAKLQFAYLENFKTKMRSTVSVREGQGVVLLCGPPPHSGAHSLGWPWKSVELLAKKERNLPGYGASALKNSGHARENKQLNKSILSFMLGCAGK